MILSVHLTTFIIASVATAGALLAIWAATSRLHWFYRALAMWAFVAAMLPIRVYEPALVFALGLPLSAIAVRGINALFQHSAQPASHYATVVRFRLLDILLAFTLVGLVLVIATHVAQHVAKSAPARTTPPLTAADILIPAFAFTSLTLFSWCLVRGYWRVLAAICLIAVVPFWTWHLWPEVNWLSELDSDFGFYYMLADQERYVSGFMVTLLGVGQFAALLCLSLAIALASVRRPNGLHVWRAIAVTGSAIFVAILSTFYVAMLWLSPFPQSVVSPNNHFSRIMKIGERVVAINPASSALEELRASSAVTAQELEDLYAELLPLLDAPNALPDDLASQLGLETREQASMDRFSTVRALGRSLHAESKSATGQADHQRAIEFALAEIRLGTMYCRNAVMVDALVGNAIITPGMAQLARLRGDLDQTQLSHVSNAMRSIESAHEPVATLVQREVAYSQRAYGWQARFGHVLQWLLSGPPDQWEDNKPFIQVENRWLACSRMLRIDLAIRRFKIASGNVPDSQEKLLPDYLEFLPLDPFSDRPFVYRAAEKGFTIYSVGTDRQNGGGQFANWANSHKSGYDLDVDALTRP
jgi:hypothetical protein